MAGRPTDCTPEMIKTIAGYIAEGLTNQDACNLACIAEVTFYDWLKRAESGEEPFAEFSKAVKKAQIQFKQTHVKNVGKKSKRNWQASAWLLERKFPDEWGSKVQYRGDAENPVVIRVVRDSSKTLPDPG